MTLYLRNAREIAITTRVIRAAGITTSNADLKNNDRYLLNIASRLNLDSATARAVEIAVKNAR